MKKLFTLSVAVLLSVLSANAQWGGDEPEQLPPLTAGYYRIVNQAYNDVLNVTDSFQIAPSALRGEASTLPSTVMYYDTDGIFTVPMPEDLSDVNVLLNWLNEISLNSYRSGSYITYKFGGNGISFIDYLNKLKVYVDRAMENFIEGDNLKFIFENDQPELIMVMVSDLLTPYAEQAGPASGDHRDAGALPFPAVQSGSRLCLYQVPHGFHSHAAADAGGLFFPGASFQFYEHQSGFPHHPDDLRLEGSVG